MFNFKGKIEHAQDEFVTDASISRARDFVVSGAPKLPSAAGVYLLEKVPIVQWLPKYQPKWLITDFIAGLTVGVMLIPQSLAYAKIATIPIANGLYSSWLPAAFAVIMGTSKGQFKAKKCDIMFHEDFLTLPKLQTSQPVQPPFWVS